MEMTLGQAIDMFIVAKQVEGRSPRTTQWYREMLERFARHQAAGLDERLHRVSVDTARAFIGDLQFR